MSTHDARTNRRYHSAETRAAAVAAYAAGGSSEVVAERFGASSTSVINWARAAGVEIRKGGAQKATEDPIEYRGGWVNDGGAMRPAKPAKRSAA